MRYRASRSPLTYLGGLLALYLAVPIGAFLVRLAQPGDKGFGAPGLWSALWTSVASATISMTIVAVLGIPLAYWLARTKGPLTWLVGLIVTLPLALPPVMSGLVLIYLVGFKNLPQSLYEAARLDGASGPQSFWYLSIPLLKPITLYVSVVTLVSGFNVYAQAFILASDSQGAPGRQVRVLVLDMLENSFRNYRVGYAASEAVVLLVIVLVLTLIQFTLLREKGGRA